MKVSTVKSGREYRAYTEEGRSYSLMSDGSHVLIYTKTASLGGFSLERFGGVLSPASIRNFFGEV